MNATQMLRAFDQVALRVFHTVIVVGLAAVAYGAVADQSSQTIGILAAASTAAVIIPLVLALRPVLENGGSVEQTP